MTVTWWPWRRESPAPTIAPPVDARLVVLAKALPGWRLELRRTRRSLLGMRRGRDGALVLRLHPELLLEPDWSVSLIEWAQRRGRGGAGTSVRTLLHACQQRLASEKAAREGTWAADLPEVGATITESLAARAEAVRAACFADLPRIPVTWSRNPPRRRLSHLRFGCYRRRERSISLSPRLARPWIASVFFDHVLHHEYCHHRQAEQPTARREGVHSPRFRAWERTFPGYVEALRWEHLALPWLLDDAPPPWYRPPGSSP